MKLPNLKPLLVHTTFTAAIAFIPAISHVISPLHTLALSIAAFAVTKFIEGRMSTGYPLPQKKIYDSNYSILKDALLLGISLSTLSLTAAAVGLGVFQVAQDLSNRVVLWLNKKTSYDTF